jgi:hypothetical protein
LPPDVVFVVIIRSMTDRPSVTVRVNGLIVAVSGVRPAAIAVSTSVGV